MDTRALKAADSRALYTNGQYLRTTLAGMLRILHGRRNRSLQRFARQTSIPVRFATSVAAQAK